MMRMVLVFTMLLVVVGLAAACGSDTNGTGAGENGDASVGQVPIKIDGLDPSGIQVWGRGTVAIEPDMALLSLGVESRADSVQDARTQAASSMNAILEALEARGIPDEDIQTSNFNISPEYSYQETFIDSVRRNERVLVGYLVTNIVNVRIGDLDIVGATVDDVAQAGGDSTRIQSLRFSLEDPSGAQEQARELAVMDAIDKADQLAAVAGVSRGSLMSINEISGGVPVARQFQAEALADFASTPIAAGELEIAIDVQAVFAIEAQ